MQKTNLQLELACDATQRSMYFVQRPDYRLLIAQGDRWDTKSLYGVLPDVLH